VNIAIIGTGNVGGAIARSAGRAGHSVVLSSADRAEAEQVAAATGATLAASNPDAVDAADIAILAVPADAYGDFGTELRDALVGKTVIDVANRPTPDPQRAGCASHAEEFQEALPEARVVKALSTVFAARQADPRIEGRRPDGYVAPRHDDGARPPRQEGRSAARGSVPRRKRGRIGHRPRAVHARDHQ
jgi:predicted dinucleotide-binding enzyme